MNYDLMTTLCGVVVAVSGVVIIDDQHVFDPRTQIIAKCVSIAATALGLYFANKTAKKPEASEEVPSDAVQP